MTALSVTDRIFFAETGIDPEKIRQIAAKGLDGAEGGELFLERTEGESLVWREEGRKVSHEKGCSEGFGFRYVAGDSIAFASSNEITESTIMEAAQTTGSIRHMAAGTIQTSSPEPLRMGMPFLYPGSNPFTDVTDEQKIAFLGAVDKFVRSLDTSVADVAISLSNQFQAVQIIKRDGERVADLRPLATCGIYVTTEKNGRRESGSAVFGGRIGSCAEMFNEARWQPFARDALRISLVNQEAVASPSGPMNVVLGPGWTGVMLHEAVGHPLEGDANRKKASVFHDKVGQRVAIPEITIIDQGNIPGRRGSLNIDDEGTPTQKTVLIENGIVRGFMQDVFNAQRMGVTSTGNGRRQNYSCMPIVRMTNTYMASGPHNPQEIIASVDKGIYTAGMSGGQVDPVSGKFVFKLTETYKIENGKLGAPLKGVTLIGKAPENMTRITMVGNDSALDTGTGMCGKEGQSVPVGVGQPTVRLDGITVGGTENPAP